MSHHLTDEELQNFLDGDVTPVQVDTIQSHLDSCEKCHEELEVYTMLFRTLDRVQSPGTPSLFTADILKKLKASPRVRTSRRMPELLLASAGILISIVAAIIFLGQNAINNILAYGNFALGQLRALFVEIRLIPDTMINPYFLTGFLIVMIIFFIEKLILRRKDLILSL